MSIKPGSVLPKILFLDIEIAKSIYAKFPPKGPEYDTWKNLIKDWWLICAAYKWDDDKTTSLISILDDKKRYIKDPTDDFHVVQGLWHLVNEADVVIGHNIEAFDWKKLYARFLFHKLPPIDKPKLIDTMKMAKNLGEFTSNSLDYLTRYLKLPKKAANRGNDMWNDVIFRLLAQDIKGLTAVIKEIVEYCKPDIAACEALYYALIPHAPAKFRLNLNAYNHPEGCPLCGSENVIKRGLRGNYQRYQCKECGAYHQVTKAVKKVTRK